MLKRHILPAVATIAITTLVAANAVSQPGPGHIMKALKQLDLSDTQKQDIRALMRQGRGNMSIYKDDLDAQMTALKDIIQAAQWNEAAALDSIRQRQDLRTQAGYQRALHKQQLWQILDESQQAEFQVLMQDVTLEKTLAKRDPLTRIDLSDEQESRLKTIKDQAKEATEQLQSQLQNFRTAERELIQSGELSESSWQTLAQEYQTAFTQMALNQAYTRHQVWHLLDAEQQEKVQKRMQKMRDRMASRMEKSRGII